MRDAPHAHTMTLPSDPLRLRDARRWIVRLAVASGIDPAHGHDLAVAFSEICTNVHRHAYRGRRDGRVDLQVVIEGERVVVTVEHQGERFDPRSYAPPNLARPAEGGYGIYLVSRLVDHVSFENTDRGGRIVLVKRRRPVGVEA